MSLLGFLGSAAGGNVLGAVGSIGASLIGGIAGNSSTKQTNATNLKIAQETNQANKDIAQMNNDAQYKLWQENNAYNTPVEQMKRYQEAGINPYIAMSSGQIGSGNSAAPAAFDSTTATQQMATPMQSYDWSQVGGSIGSTIGAMPLMLRQLEAMDKDNQNRDTNNLNQAVDTARNLKMLGFDEEANKYIKDFLRPRNMLGQSAGINDISVKMLQRDLAIKYEQQEQLRISNDIASKYGLQLSDANLRQINQAIDQSKASILEIEARTDLTRTQKDHEEQKIVNTIFERQVMSSQIAANYSQSVLNERQSALVGSQTEEQDYRNKNVLPLIKESMWLDKNMKTMQNNLIHEDYMRKYPVMKGLREDYWHYKPEQYQLDEVFKQLIPAFGNMTGAGQILGAFLR